MSDEQRKNLLKGTGKTVDSGGYGVVLYELVEPLVVGRTYTVSAYVEELVRTPLPSGVDRPVLALYDGGRWWNGGRLSGGVPGVQVLTFTYAQPFEGHADPSRLILYNTPPIGDSSVTRRARLRDVMLVEGTEPAAWAPAEGEELAGGGASMSANLLAEGDRRDGLEGTTYADGVWSIPANGTSKDKNAVNDWPTGTEAVSGNQTLHVGFSLRAADGASVGLPYGIGYVDAAGNVNYVQSTVGVKGTGAWQRVDGSLVMPSGMRVSLFFVHQGAGGAACEVTNPVLSYGSPVCLASSAHTPYATQDHVSVTYATKASLKVTDDSVKAEVSARAQTDRNVADLSSRLTQTANSLTSEISDRRSAITTVTGLANAAQSTADSASEQTVELSSRLDQSTTDITATIETRLAQVRQDVDATGDDVSDLSSRLSDEIRTRQSFMRFSEESSDPTLTLGQTDSPAQVKLTNKQLQFLYLNTVVAYMSGDALLINNAKILQQLQLGGFAFVPRQNGNLSLKWVGGDA